MKSCPRCATTFHSGLTCPGCGAFVVDPLPDDGPDPLDRLEEPDDLDEPMPAPGSLGGWVLPQATEPVVAPDLEAGDEPRAADGPAWGDPPAAVGTTTPDHADHGANLLPAEPAPGSLGGWVLPPGTAAVPRPAPPSPPAAPTPPAPSSHPGAARPAFAPPAPTGGGPAPGPPPPPGPGAVTATRARRPPRALVIGGTAAAVIVAVVAALLLLQPSGAKRAPEAVASDISGTCFNYNPDRTKVDRAVPCTQPHDATVLAFVGDPSACPDTTTAMLTGQTDSDGTRGVLCVNETT